MNKSGCGILFIRVPDPAIVAGQERIRNGMKRQKKAPIYKSFGYAFEGIWAVISKERNMQIHCCAMALVIVAGFVFGISLVKWCMCFILFGLVMALEMVNTALESVVDLVTEERKPLAKLAKDAAAGAVLVAAIMAAVTGCMIFIPELAAFFSR